MRNSAKTLELQTVFRFFLNFGVHGQTLQNVKNRTLVRFGRVTMSRNSDPLIIAQLRRRGVRTKDPLHAVPLTISLHHHSVLILQNSQTFFVRYPFNYKNIIVIITFLITSARHPFQGVANLHSVRLQNLPYRHTLGGEWWCRVFFKADIDSLGVASCNGQVIRKRKSYLRTKVLQSWTPRWVPRSAATHALSCNTVAFKNREHPGIQRVKECVLIHIHIKIDPD